MCFERALPDIVLKFFFDLQEALEKERLEKKKEKERLRLEAKQKKEQEKLEQLEQKKKREKERIEKKEQEEKERKERLEKKEEERRKKDEERKKKENEKKYACTLSCFTKRFLCYSAFINICDSGVRGLSHLEALSVFSSGTFKIKSLGNAFCYILKKNVATTFLSQN